MPESVALEDFLLQKKN